MKNFTMKQKKIILDHDNPVVVQKNSEIMRFSRAVCVCVVCVGVIFSLRVLFLL